VRDLHGIEPIAESDETEADRMDDERRRADGGGEVDLLAEIRGIPVPKPAPDVNGDERSLSAGLPHPTELRRRRIRIGKPARRPDLDAEPRSDDRADGLRARDPD
jgi:hypothetical protein